MNIRDDIRQLKTGPRELRKFGLMVGGVFVVLGLLVDIFNVFNEGVVNSYQTVATNFEEVLSIVNPRAFRAGLRFWF